MLKRTKLCTSLIVAFGSVAALPALAQPQTMERVEITGSSIKRLNAETALPVTIISVEELTKQGINTAEQALTRIAANQSNFGVSQVDRRDHRRESRGRPARPERPERLQREQDPGSLNGRRIANHAFDAAAVDLNAIPLAAVSRIEVLRDGASAIYGTDAIAGVINFILRRDYTGIEVAGEYQKPERSGGGETPRASVVAGFGTLDKDRFNVMGTLDWRKQKVLTAADRPFSRPGVLGTTRDAVTNGTSGTSFPGDLNGFEPSGLFATLPHRSRATRRRTTRARSTAVATIFRETSTSSRRTSRSPVCSAVRSRWRPITPCRRNTCTPTTRPPPGSPRCRRTT